MTYSLWPGPGLSGAMKREKPNRKMTGLYINVNHQGKVGHTALPEVGSGAYPTDSQVVIISRPEGDLGELGPGGWGDRSAGWGRSRPIILI